MVWKEGYTECAYETANILNKKLNTSDYETEKTYRVDPHKEGVSTQV